MDWMIENWYIVIALICIGACAGFAIQRFVNIPTNEQISKIKEWLLFAVCEAEKELGNGTGKLKLRMVYGMFIDKFPQIAKVISFDTFSTWVDDALANMRQMLAINSAVRNYIEK